MYSAQYFAECEQMQVENPCTFFKNHRHFLISMQNSHIFFQISMQNLCCKNTWCTLGIIGFTTLNISFTNILITLIKLIFIAWVHHALNPASMLRSMHDIPLGISPIFLFILFVIVWMVGMNLWLTLYGMAAIYVCMWIWMWM